MLKVLCLLLGLISISLQDWGVGDYIHEVDDAIVRWMKDPSSKPKKEIFEMVADYLETLQDFIEKIDLRRKTALTAGHTLLKRTQPRFLEEKFPEDILVTEHDWKGVDIDDFKRLLKEADLLWKDFEKSFGDYQQYFENEEKQEAKE